MIRRKLLLAAGAGLAGLPAGCGSKEPHPRAEREDQHRDEQDAPPSAVASTAASAGPDPSASVVAKPWLVGCYLSLSGGDEVYGVAAREGIELALAEVNAAGGAQGRPLRVLFEDDKSTPNEAMKKVEQLIDRDRVVALLGEIASSRSVVGAIVATKRSIPMVSPASTNAQVTRDKGFAFRTCFVDEMQGKAAAEFAVTGLKKKKIGLIFAEDDIYSQGLADEFKRAVEALRATVVVEKKVTQSEMNFTSLVKQLKAARPEIIYAPLYKQMIQLGRHAREEGVLGNTFLGGDGWSGDRELMAELEGAYFTDHWVIDLPWPVSRKFVQAYQSKFGKPPDSLAATGYDALLVLADAMKRARSMHGKDLRDAIAETRDFPGATGPISIDAERNGDKPITIVQIRGKAPHFASVVGRGSEAILAAAKTL